jgi:hypothetical protein
MREISESERDEIDKLLYLDEDDLYTILGAQEEAYFMPEGQREAGQKIFNKLHGALKEKLCTDWKACEKMKSEQFKDGTSLAVAIGDVISAAAMHMPPFVIAALIIKIGVRHFCDCK